MSGHKHPECDGEWIDVSTFTERRAICTKCRGSVPFIPEEEAERLPTEEPQAPRSTRRLWLLVGVGVAMALAGLALGYWLA